MLTALSLLVTVISSNTTDQKSGSNKPWDYFVLNPPSLQGRSCIRVPLPAHSFHVELFVLSSSLSSRYPLYLPPSSPPSWQSSLQTSHPR